MNANKRESEVMERITSAGIGLNVRTVLRFLPGNLRSTVALTGSFCSTELIPNVRFSLTADT